MMFRVATSFETKPLEEIFRHRVFQNAYPGKGIPVGTLLRLVFQSDAGGSAEREIIQPGKERNRRSGPCRNYRSFHAEVEKEDSVAGLAGMHQEDLGSGPA